MNVQALMTMGMCVSVGVCVCRDTQLQVRQDVSAYLHVRDSDTVMKRRRMTDGRTGPVRITDGFVRCL